MVEPNSAAWLLARQKVEVRASDAGAACGVNASVSRGKWWKQYVAGEKPPEPDEYAKEIMRRGHEDEPWCVWAFEQTLGIDATWVHSADWCVARTPRGVLVGATPDRLVTDSICTVLLECKSKQGSSTGVPLETPDPAHVVQVYLQMYTTHTGHAFLQYYRRSTGEASLFTIDWLPDLFAQIDEWLEQCVRSPQEPPRMPPGEAQRRCAELARACGRVLV
jgi:hypothetical protein